MKKTIYLTITLVLAVITYLNKYEIQDYYELSYIFPNNFRALNFSEKEAVCESEKLKETIECKRVLMARTLAQPIIDSGLLNKIELHELDYSNLKSTKLDTSKLQFQEVN